MPDLSFLPLVNATLNTTAAVLLVAGWVCIKRRHITAHKALMLTATFLSCLFLVGYLTHQTWRARSEGPVHTAYHGVGPMRTLYYTILITHVILAMTVPFFAAFLIRFAMTGRLAIHARVARIALPIWLYVSVTGLIIYLMLYPLNPTP